jgi:hypothetical protein
VKSRQLPTGAYNPIRPPWTKRDLENYLTRKVAFGHYMVDLDGLTRCLCFDIDIEK